MELIRINAEGVFFSEIYEKDQSQYQSDEAYHEARMKYGVCQVFGQALKKAQLSGEINYLLMQVLNFYYWPQTSYLKTVG